MFVVQSRKNKKNFWDVFYFDSKSPFDLGALWDLERNDLFDLEVGCRKRVFLENAIQRSFLNNNHVTAALLDLENLRPGGRDNLFTTMEI